MAKVHSPVEGFKGTVAGVDFKDGVGETDNDNAIAYFRRKGYGISGSKPTGTSPTEAPEPADPREVSDQRVGTPIRDAAVDPNPAKDFLAPTNAGQANPHGPDVVNPEVHASQGVRPVKGGEVHVDAAETEHAEQATDGTPVPGSETAAELKGQALDDALEAAGLPKSGTADEKRARLAEHRGEA